jgi:hypothetical protein
MVCGCFKGSKLKCDEFFNPILIEQKLVNKRKGFLAGAGVSKSGWQLR